jgi:aminopeptidase N
MTIQAKYRKDYQPHPYRIEKADLIFELIPERTVVKSQLIVVAKPKTVTGTELFLDGSDLELLSVSVNGEQLAEDKYRLTPEGLSIFHLPRESTIDIINVINPQANTQLNGLYVSGNTFCTQCEPHGFRRITYFIDRPDNLSRFTTTIVADKKHYPILLSNGNLVDSGEGADDQHWAQWEDPFLKPSYLFALVAGNLDLLEDEFITHTGRHVTLHIYVDLGESDKAGFAMQALKQSMHWDESVYGREYDLDIFMIVAVRDFNMGAMENKGLNIFNSKYILVNPQTATDVDYENVLRVVAHEYFHNWSGNRVTCRDWFQLSLKEGFTVFRDQTFTAEHTSLATKRIDDVNLLRNHQFAEDAGPMAHAVLPESYIEMNNFYTVTIYEKGAELIRMMSTILGPEKYRLGTDLYFEKHDGDAITIEHFVQAMEEASDIDLNHFRHWYRQAGTPHLLVKQEYDSQKHIYRLTIQQETKPTPGQQDKVPLHIPLAVGLLNQAGQEIMPTVILNVTRSTETFEFEHVAKSPIVSLLRGFSAPVKLHFDYTDAELAVLLKYDTDGFARYEAAQQLALRQIKQLIQAYQDKQKLRVEPAYLSALLTISNMAFTDKALQALLLSMPTEKYVVESLDNVDIDAVHLAYQVLKVSIAAALQAQLQKLYQTSVSKKYRYQPADTNKRRLKNTCLSYLSCIDRGELAWQQYQTADNMTDSLAALFALANNPESPYREQAINDFKTRWQNDALVMDKWFAVCASADVPNVLAEVRTILKDPLLNIKNPNSARALIGSFATNLIHFHAANGSGYQFLADQIINIDSFNPQVAARLLVGFTPWRKFDKPRQKLMQKQLKRVADKKDLSKDVYEVVHKMLGNQID